MSLKGRCYCGAVKYEADGPAGFRAQCQCRECQYISGGGANLFMILPAGGFRYTEGEPKTFQRTDLGAPVKREFCADCGTHLLTRIPSDPSIVILKIGTLDDPSVWEGPQAAIWLQDAQPFHLIPEGVMRFDKAPGG
jgi:hypothetical protein